MCVHQLCHFPTCYSVSGDTEENGSHSPWGGGPPLFLLTYETSEGPEDFE